MRSHPEREICERRLEPELDWDVHAKFIMATPNVLNEGMPEGDERAGGEAFQP